ncbi:MAG TPA: hypothetical protein VK436_15630 [Methanocella sp.]|nr:hypothetical protein [Methanocella sp.]
MPAHEDDIMIVCVPAGESATLTVANFQRIRRFVLSLGLRQTYCNMFNYNPYYPFTNFSLYLNPPNQRNINCDLCRSDFPIIVIRTTTGCNQYWKIQMMGDDTNGLVLLQQYSSIRTPDTLVKEAERLFREALTEIDKYE